MKKILVVFSLLLTLIIGMPKSMKSNADEFYEMKNYLDITNLRLAPEYGDYVFATIKPIKLKQNIKYTLAIDDNTFGRHSSFPDLVEARISQIGISTEITKNFSYLTAKKIYYVEFTPQTESIHFVSLPIDLGNNLQNLSNTFNVMLFEGSITDFDHFEVYVDPLIGGNQQGFIPIDYDNQLTVNEIKDLVIAKTPGGQIVSINIEENNYANTKNNKIGTYKMVLVANLNKNYRRFVLEIKVIDIIPPQITAPQQIIIGLADVSDVNKVKKEFTVFDNADKTLTYNDLVVLEETFSGATTLGEYSIKVSLTDESGNKTTKQVPVLVSDNKAPVITGPKSIYLYSSSETLTEAEILSRFTAYDNEEGAYQDVYITKNDYNQKTTPGSYEITIKSKDSSNNERHFNLRVYVIDDIGPIFTKDDLILTLSQAFQMTNEQLIDWFYNKINLAGENVSNVQIIFSEYDNNKTLGGTYNVYLQYERDDKTELAKITINVEDKAKITPVRIIALISLPVILGTTLFFVIKRRKP